MSDATVSWLSGPVLRARTTGRFHVSDAILVGDQQLLGEVIRVDAEGIVAQVYEDTTGLRPGDRVTSSSEPLSIRLRPGLLGKIYDGLLRPLATMPGDTVQPGMREEAVAKLGYRPLAKQGDMLRAGQVIGEFGSEDIAEKHLVPPGIGGEVVSIADVPGITGRFDGRARPQNDSRHASHWLRASASWIRCFLSRVAAVPHCRADSAPAKPYCRKASPSGAMPTSSSTSVVASAVTKWPKC
jgi:hypothetical protein